jgi:hypothetical protein
MKYVNEINEQYSRKRVVDFIGLWDLFFNLLAHILHVLDMLLVLTFQWNASFNSIFLYDFKVESLAI